MSPSSADPVSRANLRLAFHVERFRALLEQPFTPSQLADVLPD